MQTGPDRLNLTGHALRRASSVLRLTAGAHPTTHGATSWART